MNLAEPGFILRYIPLDLFAGLIKPVFFGAIISGLGDLDLGDLS